MTVLVKPIWSDHLRLKNECLFQIKRSATLLMSLEDILTAGFLFEYLSAQVILMLIKVSSRLSREVTKHVTCLESEQSRILTISGFPRLKRVVNIDLLIRPYLNCPQLSQAHFRFVFIKGNYMDTQIRQVLAWLSFPPGYIYAFRDYHLDFGMIITNGRIILNENVLNKVNLYISDTNVSSIFIQVIRRVLFKKPDLEILVPDKFKEFFVESGLFQPQQLHIY
jgi:hypothetical protein